MDLASTQAFLSFANQSVIPAVGMNNAQQEVDQSDIRLHDHAEKQEDHFSPPKMNNIYCNGKIMKYLSIIEEK